MDHSSGSSHLLRVEGVNLAHFVFDTRKLSTARGGSLLLLDAVEKAEAVLAKHPLVRSARVISRGASAGLFDIQTADPKIVAGAVREALATDANLKHATFVVDVVASTQPSDFRCDNEAVIAANRWRQMQASSLAIPPKNTTSGMRWPACALDGLRPANRSHFEPNRTDQDSFLSDSVAARLDYGRTAKQRFYQTILKRRSEAEDIDNQTRATLEAVQATLPVFANDFESIALGKTPLDGKIAVFYADGNSFGAHQSRYCSSVERQIAWDLYIRRTREGFLAAFLRDEIVGNGDEWTNATHGSVARFETLLWGGDELMFVMPASLGWRFATIFFRQLGTLNLNQIDADGQPLGANQPLTHTAALVFCQHHAPIARIKRLAKDQMAEFAKATDRSRDALVVVALESFDHLGTDFRAAMRKRYRDAIPLEDIILRGRSENSLADSLQQIAGGVRTLRESESFARSQLRALVGGMIDNHAEAQQRAQFIEKKGTWWPPPEFFHKLDEAERALLRNTLRPLFSGDAALWIQLEELWDYALP